MILINKINKLYYFIIDNISCIFYICVILLFLYISLFNHPCADDFNLFYEIKNHGFFKNQWAVYLNHGGRYFHLFNLSLINYLFSDLFIYGRFVPIIFIVLLFISIFLTMTVLFKNNHCAKFIVHVLTIIVLIYSYNFRKLSADIFKGRAIAYDNEQKARYNLIKNSKYKVCYVPSIITFAYTFFIEDYRGEGKEIRYYTQIARHFGKEEVIVLKDLKTSE